MTLSDTSRIIERLAGAICLLALASSAVYCARKIGRVADEAMVTLGSVDSTVAAVNRPCEKGKPCGTLAEVNKSMVKLQDVTVTLQRQVGQSATLVNAASSSIQKATMDVHTMALAGTDTEKAATAALSTAKETIADAQPVLQSLRQDEESANNAVTDFDNLLRSPDLASTMEHVEGMTASGDKMLSDAQWKEHELLHPTKTKGAKAAIGGAIMWLHKLEPPIF